MGYYTVESAFEGRKRVIKKSRFIASVHPITSEDQVQPILVELGKKHKKASHIAWAFALANRSDFSDDGEVKGTAGIPILNILSSRNIQNVLCVVIRYYGGINLGPSNLIKEYAGAAKELLDHIPLIELK